MTPKIRQTVYVVMAILNALLMGAAQLDGLPAKYVMYVLYASGVLAGAMHSWLAPAPDAPAAP